MPTPQAPFILFALLFALLQPGCEQRISTSNVDAMNRVYETAEKNGKTVSRKEAESVLGQPSSVERFTMSRPSTKEYPAERYIYERDGQKVELLFVDGILSGKAVPYGEKPPESVEDAKAPLKMAHPPVARKKDETPAPAQ